MARQVSLLACALTVLAVLSCASGGILAPHTAPEVADDVGRAFAAGRSDVPVEGEGTVSRLLQDDVDGPRHQRFILRMSSGQTVLISHNLDIAPRVTGLSAGDQVRFKGEYVWNKLGGLVHWTHRDPAGRHAAGWLKYNGKTYQ